MFKRIIQTVDEFPIFVLQFSPMKETKNRWVSLIPIVFLAVMVMSKTEQRQAIRQQFAKLMPSENTPATEVMDAQTRHANWSRISGSTRSIFLDILEQYEESSPREQREAIVESLEAALKIQLDTYPNEQYVVLSVAQQLVTKLELPIKFHKNEAGKLLYLTLKQDFNENYIRNKYEDLIIDWKKMDTEGAKDSINMELLKTTSHFQQHYDHTKGRIFRLKREVLRKHGLWMEAKTIWHTKDSFDIKYVIQE